MKAVTPLLAIDLMVRVPPMIAVPSVIIALVMMLILPMIVVIMAMAVLPMIIIIMMAVSVIIIVPPLIIAVTVPVPPVIVVIMVVAVSIMIIIHAMIIIVMMPVPSLIIMTVIFMPVRGPLVIIDHLAAVAYFLLDSRGFVVPRVDCADVGDVALRRVLFRHFPIDESVLRVFGYRAHVGIVVALGNLRAQRVRRGRRAYGLGFGGGLRRAELASQYPAEGTVFFMRG
jgi:hypothetical protein